MERHPEYDNEICPVCGYYCVGRGGIGCIDKPYLTGLRPRTISMNEIEKLLDEYEAAVVDFSQESMQATATHYYQAVNTAKEKVLQAKQNLLNHIKENYDEKTK